MRGVPPQLAKVGGLILPLYQSEACWLFFSASEPHAVQVTIDGVNAIANIPVNNKRLSSATQDYLSNAHIFNDNYDRSLTTLFLYQPCQGRDYAQE